MIKDLKRFTTRLAESSAAREKIESELKIAHEIQMGILPKAFPSCGEEDDIDMYALLESAKEVGGDLYDFFQLNEKKLYFVIGDVSGKGVPAAVFMSAVKTLIKATAKGTDSPSTILRIVNEEISRDNEYATFVTIFLGILNITTGEMRYANAGHNPPFLFRKDDDVAYIPSTKNMALGIDETFNFREDWITLNEGDGLFLYTDGVTEALNVDGELFSATRLKRRLLDKQNKLSKDLVLEILSDIHSFSKGIEQSDDITMLSINYRPDKDLCF